MKETKKEIKKEYKKEFVKGLDTIFILGRGQTILKCPAEGPKDSEFWGCNNVYLAKPLELDRLFIIHDIYGIQDLRKVNIIKDVNEKGFPVYTLGSYPEFKNNVRYPMEAVIKDFKTSFILNTAAHMLALAIMQKPEKILLYGVDLEYGTNTDYLRNEKGSLEYLLGVAIGRGIRFMIAEGSTLLRRKQRSNFYGFIQQKPLDDKVHEKQFLPHFSWGRPDGKGALRYRIARKDNIL